MSYRLDCRGYGDNTINTSNRHETTLLLLGEINFIKMFNHDLMLNINQIPHFAQFKSLLPKPKLYSRPSFHYVGKAPD